jgi:cupin fold WbuC family metalloprotein
MTQPLRRVNDEVFVADAPIVRFGGEELAFVKRQALANARRRARICAHRSDDDALHEMLIAISADSYIHPHKHTRKVESFHIVAGTVDVVVFEDDGTVADVIELGDASSGRSFYYRLSDSKYHTLLIQGELLVVHEVTNGPFNREETKLAPFAPPEAERDAAREYMTHVAHLAEAFRAARATREDAAR